MCQMTTTVMMGVWRHGRPNRCVEVVLSILTKGHLVDPAQAIPYRRLLVLVRMLQRWKDLVPVMSAVRTTWRPGQRDGPMGLALSELTALGFAWVPGSWQVKHRDTVTDLSTVNLKAWGHLIRERL